MIGNRHTANRREGERGRPPRVLRAFVHQLRYDLIMQVRNPAAMFFSIGLPLIFLVAFVAIGDNSAEAAEYYTPATMTIAIVTGTTTNIAITLVYLREYGLLKRMQLLPVPRVALLGSRVAASALLAMAAVLLLGVVAAVGYGTVPEQPVQLALITALLAVTGSALGAGLTVVIPSENAAGPISNALALPMLMISGGFFPLESAPEWVRTLASRLPFEPGLDASVTAYAGTLTWTDLGQAALVMGGWTLVVAALGVRFFSWTPRHRR